MTSLVANTGVSHMAPRSEPSVPLWLAGCDATATVLTVAPPFPLEQLVSAACQAVPALGRILVIWPWRRVGVAPGHMAVP